MDDFIRRQDAITALSHMMDTDGFRDGWAVSRANVDSMLRTLASVQPEPKGHWIEKKDKRKYAYGKCSNCGIRMYAGRTKYCPNCGAKMENAI